MSRPIFHHLWNTSCRCFSTIAGWNEIIFILNVIMSKYYIILQRKQHPGETVAEFIADLRRLAQDCNFVDLETMLRDRLVCGVRNEAVQLQLFAQKVLTFQMTQEEALSAEAACKHASEIHAVNVDLSAPNIHHMSSKRQTYKHAYACASCGGQHNRPLCRFKNAVCRCRQKAGHIERVCRSKQRRSKPQAKTNAISVAVTHQSYLLNRISCPSTPSFRSLKLSVFLSTEGKCCQLEVDSGSDVTIISEQTFEDLRHNNKKLKLAPTTLSHVSFLGNCPNLLGLEWLKPLGIRIEGINHINSSPVESVLRKYQAVFTPDLDCYAGEPVSLDLDPSVPPFRMKAHKVPLALKENIDMELDKLVKQKVLEPVSHPVWATPIITPMKPGGSVRICGDYKCTINKALRKHAYTVPAVNHLLASLAGGKAFAKLDLAQAYQQLVVDKKTADAQTIITHQGVFRVTRLQFGVCAAPGIFQGVIDQLTKCIPGVLPYFDDILIVAKDESMLAKRLATLLKRFYDAGLRLNAEKCKFCLRRIQFLGFDIDASGIHPSKQKVAAIHNTPQPKNKEELQTFLGLLNFYHSFLQNKATVAEPLHRLLDKETKWKWTNKHKKAFNQATVIIRFCINQLRCKKPLVLICDASPVGTGAVLCHQMPNDHKPLLEIFAPNKETPYILSLRMLRWTVMLGAYVYDICYRPRKLIANADILSRLPTKIPDVEIPPPLEVLMLESDDTVIMKDNDIARMSLKDPVISRVLNWAWKGWPAKLSDEKFKPFFSTQLEISVHKGCLLWGNGVAIPIQARSRLLTMLHDGHPGIVHMKALARSYFWWPKMDESIEKTVNTCDVCQSSRAAMPKAPVHSWETPNNPWSIRIEGINHINSSPVESVLRKYQAVVTPDLGCYAGEPVSLDLDPSVPPVRMKARKVPLALKEKIDMELDKLVKQKVLEPVSHPVWATPIVTPMKPDGSVRICGDYKCTINKALLKHAYPVPAVNHLLASLADAQTIITHRGAFRVKRLQFGVSAAPGIFQGVTDQLTKGIPGVLPYFDDILIAAKDESILAKRLATLLKRFYDAGLRLNAEKCKFSNFLFSQPVSPCATTGKSPAELLMKRRLRTVLDRIHPDIEEEAIEGNRDVTKSDKQKIRIFTPDDLVFVRNYAHGPKWCPATIVAPTGPVSYKKLEGADVSDRDLEIYMNLIEKLREDFKVRFEDLKNIDVQKEPVEIGVDLDA
ncbi:Uncharacterized protein T01_13067 [Trichinella spiralis]|uniref:RNA-directed DNA polymerase n=1 Tax=Trichinella spiralis TaxID=6334 RepID=A0A0V1ASQ8_TRISP|nr:Uncharacterized protein T01_13067 [Trichinella spiralis]